jgi:hypothetical protein
MDPHGREVAVIVDGNQGGGIVFIGDLGFEIPVTFGPVVRGKGKRWIRVAPMINFHWCVCRSIVNRIS